MIPDLETMRKFWEGPLGMRETFDVLQDSIRRPMKSLADYQTAVMKNTMEFMSRGHSLWLEGVELYLRSRREMTSFMKDKLPLSSN
jgi:hypothetical protein